ncbi:MAG: flavodoxin-dependent (E)-4-hydroxy-3-methylbut-2-enyl-diphosphate synthase, partial [Bacteroidia bacterium]
NYSVPLDKWNLTDQACDFIYVGDNAVAFEIPGTLGLILNSNNWKQQQAERRYPLFCGNEFFESAEQHPVLNFVAADNTTLTPQFIEQLKHETRVVLVLDSMNDAAMPEMRRAAILLMDAGCKTPFIIKRNFMNETADDTVLFAATDAGALLLDGFGDGLWIKTAGQVAPRTLNSAAFGILQATRTRISKTEYISCPSCGRTLFDLQDTTNKIRKRTEHLKGVKIGIMGCIVNGPGEMADADYGYVGTGVGKITLYKGREVVQRNIDEENAVEALVELIRTHGDWIEAPLADVAGHG